MYPYGRFQRTLRVTFTSAGFTQEIGILTVIVKSTLSDARFTQLLGKYETGLSGKTVRFKLQSYDPSGDPRIDGGDYYHGFFDGPLHGPRPPSGRFRPVIVDAEDGTYDISYQITAPGEYELNLFMDDTPIGTGLPPVNKLGNTIFLI